MDHSTVPSVVKQEHALGAHSDHLEAMMSASSKAETMATTENSVRMMLQMGFHDVRDDAPELLDAVARDHAAQRCRPEP